MPTLSPVIVHLLAVFAPAFTRPTVDHALVLLAGTLLASGRRTVAAALRAVGLQHDPYFATYHRVLNRAAWSAKEEATFVDLLAVVRRELWRTRVANGPTRVHDPDLANSPDSSDPALASLLEAACSAA